MGIGSDIIYYICAIIYCVCYYTNNTWLVSEDFTWPHLIFLLSCLLLLGKYKLVPQTLTCPPLYIVYKVIAAVLLANMALFTIFLQFEDLLRWILHNLAVGMKKIGFDKGHEILTSDNVIYYAMIGMTVYLLLWVIASSGCLPKECGAAPSGPAPSPSKCRPKRRRKSKPRC